VVCYFCCLDVNVGKETLYVVPMLCAGYAREGCVWSIEEAGEEDDGEAVARDCCSGLYDRREEVRGIEGRESGEEKGAVCRFSGWKHEEYSDVSGTVQQ